MPTIDKSFCAAVVRAQTRILKEREEKDTCPREMAGCGRRGALCSVTRRGMNLGKFCPHCGWSTLFLDKAKERTKVARSKRVKR